MALCGRQARQLWERVVAVLALLDVELLEVVQGYDGETGVAAVGG